MSPSTSPVTVAKAKNRIINALGDLYRIQRHSTGMSAAQKKAVADAIAALEEEYMALLALSGPASYAKVTAAFTSARGDLQKIVAERTQLANAFVSVSKILGSLTQVLKL